MSAIQYWRDRVEAHHQQSQKVQAETSWSQGEFWRPFSSFFKADPHRTDDPVLDRLAREVAPGHTVLDVGAGAGRFALPLALRSQYVVVVEPSESMLEGLNEVARESNITNISVVQASWEDAEVDAADVVLCAHVVYGVADVEPFIRKLESHARERVLILAFMTPPIARFSPFWKYVHGEPRIDMPAARELINVLWEMDIYPDVEMLPLTPPRGFKDWDHALEQLRQRLYVKPDTDQDRRLQDAMRDLLIETEDGLTIKGIPPGREALISWRPHSG